MSALAEKYDEDGLRLVAVNNGEPAREDRGLPRAPARLGRWCCTTATAPPRANGTRRACPPSFLVDRDGARRLQHLGALDWSQPAVLKPVTALLNVRRARGPLRGASHHVLGAQIGGPQASASDSPRPAGAPLRNPPCYDTVGRLRRAAFRGCARRPIPRGSAPAGGSRRRARASSASAAAMPRRKRRAASAADGRHLIVRSTSAARPARNARRRDRRRSGPAPACRSRSAAGRSACDSSPLPAAAAAAASMEAEQSAGSSAAPRRAADGAGSADAPRARARPLARERRGPRDAASRGRRIGRRAAARRLPGPPPRPSTVGTRCARRRRLPDGSAFCRRVPSGIAPLAASMPTGSGRQVAPITVPRRPRSCLTPRPRPIRRRSPTMRRIRLAAPAASPRSSGTRRRCASTSSATRATSHPSLP